MIPCWTFFMVMVTSWCNETTWWTADAMILMIHFMMETSWKKWLYDCEIIKIIDDDMTWWWIHNSMLNFMKYCDRRQPWNAGCVWNRGIPPNKWLYHAKWSLTRKSGGFSLNLQTVCQFWSWWCLLWQSHTIPLYRSPCYSQSHIFIGSWLELGCRATNRAVRSMPMPASTWAGYGSKLGGHKGTVAASYAARSYGILKIWAPGKFWSNVSWKLLFKFRLY